MSRDIKFRVWADNKMDYSPETFTGWLNDNFEFDGYEEGKEPIVMQFTGLKDRNGVLIFEGDIVRINGWNCEVYYDESKARFSTEIYDKDSSDELHNFGLEGIEVKGDIYRNPELLTK